MREKQKITYLLIFVLVCCFIGCNTNNPEETNSTSGGDNKQSETIILSVSPTKLTFTGFYMVSYYIDIKCNTSWKVEIENENMFQSVNPRYNGSGNTLMSVTVPEISSNKQNSFSTQYGSITISCKDEKGKTLSQKVECVRKKY